jgi:hypothetical protein
MLTHLRRLVEVYHREQMSRARRTDLSLQVGLTAVTSWDSTSDAVVGGQSRG